MPDQGFGGLDLPTTTFTPSGKNYLYIVGIDEYPDMPPLYNAKLDAERVRKVLQEKYQFDEALTHCQFNEEATQAGIVQYLRSLVRKITPEDNFLMYFAGHGEYDEDLDLGYWIPYDAKSNQIGSYISFDLVTRLIRAIKSRHTFIITDSCYSGSIFTQKRDSSYKDRLESMPSRWLLTAGRNEPVNDGRPGQHSPFAQAVLAALEYNNEQRLRVSAFCDRVLQAVGNNSDQLPRGASLYDVGDMGGEFMFRLKDFAYAPVQEAAPAAKPGASGGSNRGGGGPAQPAPSKPKMGSLADIKAALKKYLIADEFKAAFDLLNSVIANTSHRENDIIALQGRYNSMHKQHTQGLVDQSFAQVTYNQIRHAMISLVEALEAEDLKPGLFDAVEEERKEGDSDAKASLSALEQSGLRKQAELLQRKLNMAETALITSYDPAQKFGLEVQIEEAKHQLEMVKKKLG